MLGIWERMKRIRPKSQASVFLFRKVARGIRTGETLDGSDAYITKGTANNRDYRVNDRHCRRFRSAH